jgi:hypothetical protein
MFDFTIEARVFSHHRVLGGAGPGGAGLAGGTSRVREDTVSPQLERALLAGHDVVLLGERGLKTPVLFV